MDLDSSIQLSFNNKSISFLINSSSLMATLYGALAIASASLVKSISCYIILVNPNSDLEKANIYIKSFSKFLKAYLYFSF